MEHAGLKNPCSVVPAFASIPSERSAPLHPGLCFFKIQFIITPNGASKFIASGKVKWALVTSQVLMSI